MCRAGTYTPGSGASSCLECPVGSYVALEGMTQCLPCGKGLFGGTQGLAACQPCQPGRFNPDLGAGVCMLCGPGEFSDWSQGSACGVCPAGTYEASAGSTACVACPGGTFSGGLGLDDAGQCEPCPAGYYSNGTGLTSAQGCLRCPVGLMSDAGGTTCVACRPGEFPNEAYGACATCPLHSELEVNASGPEECLCQAGHRLAYNSRALGGIESYDGLTKVHTFESPAEGIRLFVSAFVEVLCAGVRVSEPYKLPAGFYPGGQGSCSPPKVVRYPIDVWYDASETQTYVQCMPCGPGAFSLNMSGGSCLLCPPRTYQDEAGATGCKRCATGDPARTGMITCNPCPGQTVLQEGECRRCPDGLFYPLYLTEPACLPCPANMWSDEGSGGCLFCPASSTSGGGTGLDGCKCNGGLELRRTAQGPVCIACQRGSFSGVGGNVCRPCQNGTFSTAARASTCFQCPAGAISWNGATSCTNCVLSQVPSGDGGSCVFCPAGYYCGTRGVLVSCPLGTYSLKTGLTLKSQCPPCPRNSFCRSPLLIEGCPANTWSPLGSVTRHYCVCNNGFKCTYFAMKTGNFAVTLTPDMIWGQLDPLILAIAQATGSDPGSVSIVGRA